MIFRPTDIQTTEIVADLCEELLEKWQIEEDRAFRAFRAFWEREQARRRWISELAAIDLSGGGRE